MKCPVCNKAMKKVRWEISNNFRTDELYKEYDKTLYECKTDDVWVSVETPIKQKKQ